MDIQNFPIKIMQELLFLGADLIQSHTNIERQVKTRPKNSIREKI